MFNSQPLVSLQDIGQTTPCVIVDEVLTHPQSLVDFSTHHWPAFEPAAHNAFPGPELPLSSSAVARLVECFLTHAAALLDAGDVIDAHGRLSMVTLQPHQLRPIQRVCHRDRLASQPDEKVLAAVLYLFRDPTLGGTGFFRSKLPLSEINERMRRWAAMDALAFEQDTGWCADYMTTSNAYFDRQAVVAPRFNRMIFYDGSQFHCSQIERPERLTCDPSTGRLTLNMFMRCKRRGHGAFEASPSPTYAFSSRA